MGSGNIENDLMELEEYQQKLAYLDSPEITKYGNPEKIARAKEIANRAIEQINRKIRQKQNIQATVQSDLEAMNEAHKAKRQQERAEMNPVARGLNAVADYSAKTIPLTGELASNLALGAGGWAVRSTGNLTGWKGLETVGEKAMQANRDFKNWLDIENSFPSYFEGNTDHEWNSVGGASQNIVGGVGKFMEGYHEFAPLGLAISGVGAGIGIAGKALGAGEKAVKTAQAVGNLGLFASSNVANTSDYIEQTSGKFKPVQSGVSSAVSALAMEIAFALGRGRGMNDVEASNYATRMLTENQFAMMSKKAFKQSFTTAIANGLLNGGVGTWVREEFALPDNPTQEDYDRLASNVWEAMKHETAQGAIWGGFGAIQYHNSIRKLFNQLGGKETITTPDGKKRSVYKTNASAKFILENSEKLQKEKFPNLFETGNLEEVNTYLNELFKSVPEKLILSKSAEFGEQKENFKAALLREYNLGHLKFDPNSRFAPKIRNAKENKEAQTVNSLMANKVKGLYSQYVAAKTAIKNIDIEIEASKEDLQKQQELARQKEELQSKSYALTTQLEKPYSVYEMVGFIRNALEKQYGQMPEFMKRVDDVLSRYMSDNWQTPISADEAMGVYNQIAGELSKLDIRSGVYNDYNSDIEDIISPKLIGVDDKPQSVKPSTPMLEAPQNNEPPLPEYKPKRMDMPSSVMNISEGSNQPTNTLDVGEKINRESPSSFKESTSSLNIPQAVKSAEPVEQPSETGNIKPIRQNKIDSTDKIGNKTVRDSESFDTKADMPQSVMTDRSESPAIKNERGKMGLDVEMKQNETPKTEAKTKVNQAKPQLVDESSDIFKKIDAAIKKNFKRKTVDDIATSDLVDLLNHPNVDDKTKAKIEKILKKRQKQADFSKKAVASKENPLENETVSELFDLLDNPKVNYKTKTKIKRELKRRNKIAVEKDLNEIKTVEEADRLLRDFLKTRDIFGGQQSRASDLHKRLLELERLNKESANKPNAEELGLTTKRDTLIPKTELKYTERDLKFKRLMHLMQHRGIVDDISKKELEELAEQAGFKNVYEILNSDIGDDIMPFVKIFPKKLKSGKKSEKDFWITYNKKSEQQIKNERAEYQAEQAIKESAEYKAELAKKYPILNDIGTNAKLWNAIENTKSKELQDILLSENAKRFEQARNSGNLEKWIEERKAFDNAKQSTTKKSLAVENIVRGNKTKMTTKANGGMTVDGQFGVVDVNNLQTATSIGETQNRNRETIASQAQINSIGNNPNPEYLIVNNPDSANGAMVITSDGKVLSGNGRTLGLKMAYESGNGEKYRAYLKEHAKEFGIDPKDVDKIKNPVLVRIVDPKEGFDLKRFVKESNESQQLGRNAAEIARTDAENIKDILRFFNGTKELNSESNSEFIRKFFEKTVGDTERANYLANDGSLTPDGERRITNALIASLYGNNPRLIERLSNTTNEGVKKIANALIQSANDSSKLRGEIQQGKFWNVDLGKDISDAALAYMDTVGEMNRQKAKGSVLSFYLKNMKDRLSPDGKVVLGMFSELKSAQRIKDFINIMNGVVRGKGDPNQGLLFGESGKKPTNGEIIREALQEFDSQFKTDFSKKDLKKWNMADKTLFDLNESRARNKVTNPVTDKDLNNFLKGQGKQITKDTGLNFKVVDSVDELRKMFPNNDITDTVEGGIHKDTVYLVRGNIDKDRLPLVIAHEVAGHRGVESLFENKQQMDRFFNSLERAAVRDKFIRDAFAEVDRLGYKENRSREAMAKIVEKVKNESGTLKGTAKTFVNFISSRVRRFLRKLGFKNLQLNESEVYDIAVQALRRTGLKNSNKFFGLDRFLAKDNSFLASTESSEREKLDQLAKESGYNIKAYHGTDKEFDVFKPNNAQGWGKGIYFASEKNDAENYGKNVKEFYISLKNPFDPSDKKANEILDSKAPNTETYKKMVKKTGISDYVDLMNELSENNVDAYRKIIEESGFDGIKAYKSNDINGWEYVIFNPEQAKLADLKTFKDGKEVPLEDRFNKSKADIQFSIGERKSPIEDVAGKASNEMNTYPRRRNTKVAKKVLDKNFDYYEKLKKGTFKNKKLTDYKASALKASYLTGYDTKEKETMARFRAIGDFNKTREAVREYIDKTIPSDKRAKLLDSLMKQKTTEGIMDIAGKASIEKERAIRNSELEILRQNLKDLKANKISTEHSMLKLDALSEALTQEELDGLLNTNDFSTGAVRKMYKLLRTARKSIEMMESDEAGNLKVPDKIKALASELDSQFNESLNPEGNAPVPPSMKVSVETLAKLNHILKDIKDQSRIAKVNLAKDTTNEAYIAKEKIVGEMKPVNEAVANSRETNRAGLYNTHFKPISAMNTLDLDNFTSEMGETMNKVAYKDMLAGQRRKEHYLARGYKQVDDIIESFGKDKEDGLDNLNKTFTTVETSDKHKYDITRDEAMAIYAMSTDRETRKIIKANGGLTLYLGDKKGSDSFTLSTDKLNEIAKNLTAKEKEAVMRVKKSLAQDYLPELNAVHEKLNGVPLRLLVDETYFPRTYMEDSTTSKGNGVLDGLSAPYVSDTANAEWASLLKHRGDGAKFRLRGLTKTYENYVDQASNYIGMAEPLKKFNRILDKGMEKEITQRYGAEYVYRLKRMTELNAGMAGKTKEDQQVLSRYLSNIAAAKLTPVSALKQFSSVPLASSVIPYKYLAQAMFSGVSKENISEMMELDPMVLRYRDNALGGIMPLNATNMETERNIGTFKGNGLWNKIVKGGLNLSLEADKRALGIIYKATKLMAEAQGKGGDKAYIENRFMEAVRRTQNTTDLASATGWQEMSRKSSHWAFLNMYLNQTQKLPNEYVRLKRMITQAEKTHGKDSAQYREAKGNLVNFMIGMGLMNAVSIGLGASASALLHKKDEKKTGKETAAEIVTDSLFNFVGNPILKPALGGSGYVLQKALPKSLGGKRQRTTSEAFGNDFANLLPDATYTMSKMMEDLESDEPVMRKLKKVTADALGSKSVESALAMGRVPTWYARYIYQLNNRWFSDDTKSAKPKDSESRSLFKKRPQRTRRIRL